MYLSRNRVLCLLVTLIVLVGAFAGCAPSGAPAASDAPAAAAESSGAGEAAATEAPAAPAAEASPGSGGVSLPIATELTEYSFMIVEDPVNPFVDTFVVLPEVERQTNVRFNLTKVPQSNYSDKLSVTLASGDIPDYISNVKVDIANQYGPKGLFLNIWDYMDIMPNLSAAFEKYPGFNDFKYSETELYQLMTQCSPDSDPLGFAYYKQVPMIREDVLDSLSLEFPTTFDELHDVLAAIKGAYPDSYPWVALKDDNTSGLEPLLTQMLVAWSGDVLSWQYYYTNFDAAADTWSFALERPGFKELIEYLTAAYAEGLLDPEFLVMQGAQWEERIVNEQGFFSYVNWNNSDNITLKGQSTGKPDFKVFAFKPPVKDGKASVITRAIAQNFNAINSQVHDPEILMKTLDWWLFSQDGTMIANAGILDENYVWEEENAVYRLIDPELENPSNESHSAKYGTRYGFMTGLRPDHFDIHNFVANPDENIYYQQQLIYSGTGTAPAPTIIMTNTDDAEILRQVGVPVRDYIEQMLARIITGVDDVSTWDAVVQTCKDMGIDQVVEILNK